MKALTSQPPACFKPGVHQIPEDEYHGGPGISKTGLWKIYKRSPFHYRYAEDAETSEQKFGTASHTAVLEPNLFEPKYTRGPAVNKNTNEWKAAVKIAEEAGKTCIDHKDYDNAQRLRDALYRDPTVRNILTTGAPSIEQSAYYIDDETGELCRVRPDVYNHKLKLIADLKCTTNAHPDTWKKRVEEFGYFLQDEMYSAGWEAAGGGPVDAFVFITVEDKPPFAFKLYELPPSAREEGAAVYRVALDNYHKCAKWEREARDEHATGKKLGHLKTPAELEDFIRDTCWPGYDKGVDTIDMWPSAYKLTRRD